MDTQDLKIDAALICDDIRSELGGKAILIGVYTGDILLSRAPATIHVSLWLAGRLPQIGGGELKIKVHLGDRADESADTVTQPVSMQRSQNGEFYVAINGIVLNITEPTPLTVLIKKNDDDWIVVTKKQILVAPPPTGSPSSIEESRLS